jgi:hypothetical protein
MNACPACGGPMREVRLGVRLTPLKAAIFDAIKRAGPEGISRDDLMAKEFSEGAKHPWTLKSHICQINDSLVATDYRIRSIGRCYHLTRNGASAA